MHNRFIAFFIALAVAPFAWPLPSAALQVRIVPGSSVTGAELFQQKGCASCHTSDRMIENKTPASMAAALWNHSPEMWSAQKQRDIQPQLTSAEAADLFAYLFSLSYVNTPGNPGRGRRVFETKSCSQCHDIEVGKPRPGPPVSTWHEVNDPLAWAETMWNHSHIIYTELASRALPWPQFSIQDMLDLLAYLRTVSASQSAGFQPGNPELGRVTFENACESCHSFGSRTTRPKIDLMKRAAPDLLTDYVVAMWNHAPLMRQRAGTDFPILGPGDMANLVAYLFSQRYFDQEGNAERGAKVFEAKGCAGCHVRGRAETGAPDLAMANERYSAITIAASLFRHGRTMVDLMKSRGGAWPQFTPAEMQDLIGFLNSRLILKAALR